MGFIVSVFKLRTQFYVLWLIPRKYMSELKNTFVLVLLGNFGVYGACIYSMPRTGFGPQKVPCNSHVNQMMQVFYVILA